MRGAVYVASPLSEVEHARRLADLMRSAGRAVVSHWHDAVEPGAVDPSDPSERAQLLLANLRDLERADVMLLWTATGTPGCSLVELGVALASGHSVVWVQGPWGVGRNLADASPCVVVVDALDDGAILSALAVAEGIS